VLRIRHAAGIAAVVVAAGSALGGTALASHQTTNKANATVHITVTGHEFDFKLSKTSVTKGTTVVFKFVNAGVVAHDFDFPTLHKKTKILASKKSQLLTSKFTKTCGEHPPPPSATSGASCRSWYGKGPAGSSSSP
jgi:plastocyanin